MTVEAEISLAVLLVSLVIGVVGWLLKRAIGDVDKSIATLGDKVERVGEITGAHASRLTSLESQMNKLWDRAFGRKTR